MIKLRSGASHVVIEPAYGGAITQFSHDGQPLFRSALNGWQSAGEGGAHDPLMTACFPLIPYSNRVRDGHFIFDGKAVALPQSSSHAHGLHGIGWIQPWTVIDASDTHCVCEYDHSEHSEGGGWPWAFRAQQSLHLSDGSLSLSLSIENRSSSPMPAGLGPHPYFPSADTARLQFGANGVWHSEGDLPTRWDELPERWDFTDPRRVAGADVDHCFTGFDGRAQIDWDGARYGLSISTDAALGHAVLFVPEGEDYFCFEPVSHMNDALNWAHEIPGTGLVSLAPGEVLSATTVFAVTP